MQPLETLRALNDADRWIERVLAQREHLPELEELATLEVELRALLASLHEAQAVAEPVRARYRAAEEVARRHLARSNELERALAASTGSPRDLTAMQHEWEQVRQRVTDAEDEELNLLLELEPLDETIAAIKNRATPGVERRGELQVTVTQLRATLDEEIGHLRESRAGLAHQLEPTWRQRYDAALARAGVSGAATVAEGRCEGCRIALSPLDYDRFRHLAPDQIMDCPECGRLLLP